ncbi:MAG: DUF2723 domain-containing protein [Bacteroidales bacterium]
MERFKFWNNLTGWVIFLISAATYLLTMEPTASLWDCGEFISSAFKLQVGHPPGAPLFMIAARFFTLFAGGDVSKVALMVNIMSALASAFTVLFLFWTISHLVRKLVSQDGSMDTGKLIAILGSAVAGSLAYNFSDSAWFSAVEGEVYASSSLFTAVVFWAILKWENVADEKYANRWLVFIGYLMGLSIGVHLLNLLTIPALVMVYYFKKFTVSKRGFIMALLVSVIILASVMYGVIPGIIEVASWFELAFTNGFGLPFNIGVLFFALLLLAFIVGGLRFAEKRRMVVVHTAILCLTVMVIGYSSYAMIVIRAFADPPMDENSPDNVFALKSYLARDQYGDRPLFFGQYYNAPIVGMEEGKTIYAQVDGKYKEIAKRPEYIYAPELTGFFPRMWSPDPSHKKIYQEWGGKGGSQVTYTDRYGKPQRAEKPSFAQNMKFFFKYQVGYMYFRYFMWNFSGKQNDIQGDGGIVNGNWITGINFIDSIMLGPQDELPAHYKNHEGRNKYYLLPLLLGIIGLMFQLQKDKKDFFVVFLLFFMTGLAIVIYLNQTPQQPRERDYSYAGSFYAFAIWIGLGVYGLFDMVKSGRGATVKAAAISLACLILVPGIMASENWDDHDRSGRYTTRDLAANYLNSCPPNAILFTNGDNDTFPLWYAQEVEGIRTDVRVCNLMLLNMDWYVDMMKRKAYESDPLPIKFNRKQYLYGSLDQVYLLDSYKDPIPLKEAMSFLASDDPRTKTLPNVPERIEFLPGRTFLIPVDSAAVIANGTVDPKDASGIVPGILWRINKETIGKSEVMVLDMMAQGNWKRPICYAALGVEGNQGLEAYTQLNGFAWQLVPIQTEGRNYFNYGRINTGLLYDNLMNKFNWGRMNEPDVHLDYHVLRTISVMRVRNTFNRLAEELTLEGKNDSALKVLDRCMELTPVNKVPYDLYTLGTIRGYYAVNATDKANAIVTEFSKTCMENLDYFLNLNPRLANAADIEIQESLQYLQNMIMTASSFKQDSLVEPLKKYFEDAMGKYQLSGGQ